MKNPFMLNSGVYPLGIPVSHSWLEVGAILMLIEKLEVSLFVELGVHHGGLSSLLVHRTEYAWEPFPEFHYIGIEISLADVHPQLLKTAKRLKNARIWSGDVFGERIKTGVDKFIQECAGKAMIYCDNGYKPKELRVYRNLLREGDIIAAHDYRKEIADEDFKNFDDLVRLKYDYLNDTRIVAFWKK